MQLRGFLLAASILVLLAVVRGAPHKRESCPGKTCPGNQRLYGCECRCPEVLDCTNLSPNYTFNDYLCACQCRNVPKCPAGSRLNFLTCTCELPCPQVTDYTCPEGEIFSIDACECFDPTNGRPRNPGEVVLRDTATCAIPPPPPPYPPPPPVQRECTLECTHERQELDIEKCECVCVTVLKAPCPPKPESTKSGSKTGTKKSKGKSHSSSSGSRRKRSHSNSPSDECEYEWSKSDSSKSDSSKSDSSKKSKRSKSDSSRSDSSKSDSSKSDTSKSGSPPSGPVELTECPAGQLLDPSICECYWEGEL